MKMSNRFLTRFEMEGAMKMTKMVKTAQTNGANETTKANDGSLPVRSGLRAGFRLSGWGDVGFKPRQ